MKKIKMVGNTHFDPVWLWRWDEAMSSITATFRAALERMKEYDDFTYSFSAPAVFEWIKKTDPDLMAEIKKRIDEGRWELCEGWWLQADCNSALGESYVRQGLYAQKYFEENFGKRSRTVFNIDSFGHPATLPQILSGCGIENYVFWRPNEEHKHIETPLFTWKGENNTSVKTYRIGGEGGEIFTPDITEDTLNPLVEKPNNTPHDLMVVYGVTDHGGAPTKKMIEKIIEKKEQKKAEFDITFGRVDDYFDELDMSNVPEIADELQVKFIGPYSNYMPIKKNNRLCEYSIMNAEKVSVILEKLMGTEYPKKELNSCWEDLMFNQFHDILGGCIIEDAYFDARNMHGRALQTSNEIVHFGLQTITNKIKMPGKNPDNAWNIVVWNLNGFDVNTEIEAEVQWAWEFDWYAGNIELEDELGNVIPCQIIEELPVLPKFRSRFVFKTKLPALGYKSFIVRQTGGDVKRVIENKYENDSFRLVIDSSDNVSLFDKKKNKTILKKFCVPYVVKDICDTWGFNKTVYEDEKEYLKLVNSEVIEDGIYRTTILLNWKYNNSSVEQKISLYEGHVDCKYRVMWNEEWSALKFETSKGNPADCDVAVPYGRLRREKSIYEKPMGEWVSLTDSESTVSLIADSIFAYNFDGENIGMTVLRNSLFGDLRTEELDATRHNRFMGQGVSEGGIRLVIDAEPDKEGVLFNNKPIVLCEANHDGKFSSSESFMEEPKHSVLTTLKKSEDGKKVVLRLYNPVGEKVSDEFSLFGEKCNFSSNRYEIKTLTLENGKYTETNMLEEQK